MKDNVKTALLAHVDRVIASYSEIKVDPNDTHLNRSNYLQFVLAAAAAIERVTGENNTYTQAAKRLVSEADLEIGANEVMGPMLGILRAVRNDLDSGFLTSAKELIHGELFSDFLEMAEHLFDEGYTDAAAVIGGSVLEAHIRQLCINNNIDTDRPDGSHKTADMLNADLAKASIYSKNEQKQVTAWQAIRNSAAHGDYKGYTKEEAGGLLRGIREFTVRNPA